MLCAYTQFPALPFGGPHEKPHGVRGLSKHYHLQLEPKLDNDKCAIIWIPCDCNECTKFLDKPWEIGVGLIDKPCYHWIIIQFSKKSTTYEYYDDVHKFVLYGISEIMSPPAQNGKYDAFNTEDPTTPGYYVVKFIPEPNRIQVKKK